MRAYLEVHDPIEIGIQIFEICKGGNLGVFDDACFSLHLRRFTNVVGAKSDLRRSRGAGCSQIHSETFDTKKTTRSRPLRQQRHDLAMKNALPFGCRLRRFGGGAPYCSSWRLDGVGCDVAAVWAAYIWTSFQRRKGDVPGHVAFLLLSVVCRSQRLDC